MAEQQIVALLGHLADRALAAGAHPDRRVRLLRRRRLDNDLVEGPVCAPMRERLVGCPRLEDHLETLVEARVSFLHRHAESSELVVPVAFADAEIEPAPGQQVEGSRLLRQQHGIVPGQHEHCGAQAQPARARAEPGQQVERGRDLAIAGEVVLDDERAVEAERLGLDVVVDEIAEPLAAVELGTTAPRRCTAEQTELHRSPLWCRVTR